MGNILLTDEDVQKSLDYLRDSAPKAAVARSQAKTMEKYVGIVEARAKILATQDGLSNAASQDWARSSVDYKTSIDAWQEAVRVDCEFTMLREAAASRLDAWRTWQATERMARI